MKPKLISCAFAAAVALACGAAVAQTRPAPGLWEYRMTARGPASAEADAAMAQMREELAKLSPQERAQAEAALRRAGIGLPGAAGAPMTLRVCVTPEDAARDFTPIDPHCTQSVPQRSGNTVRFRFSCTGEVAASGEGEATFSGDRAYTGRMTMTTMRDGKPDRVEMATDATWIGADCGTVKSRSARLPAR